MRVEQNDCCCEARTMQRSQDEPVPLYPRVSTDEQGAAEFAVARRECSEMWKAHILKVTERYV